MSVEFENENTSSGGYARSSDFIQKPSAFANFFIKRGIVKNEDQATMLLIGLAVCNVLITAIVLYIFVF